MEKELNGENMYRVAEKFVSINGEGRKAGELAVFIRFVGCNLRCSYCDTLWALEKDCPYEAMSGEEILAYIKGTGVKNVTLTGGEPLIQKGMKELISLLLKDETLFVEIETNGAVEIMDFLNFDVAEQEILHERLSFTLDYKCSGSGMAAFNKEQNFEKVRSVDTYKFVVSSREDLDEMRNIITKHDLINKCKVYVSAVFGQIEPVEIVEYMMEHSLNDVRLQLQLHKFIWDPMKKGV